MRQVITNCNCSRNSIVAVFITLTEFELLLATYTLLPSGLTETPKGPEPTAIVSETVLVELFITLTIQYQHQLQHILYFHQGLQIHLRVRRQQ